MSERFPQDNPDWRRLADEQLAQPHEPDPAELLQKLQEQYETEVMGVQRAAWELALGALVRHGRPRCYDNLFATHPEYSPLSTGLLSLGETVVGDTATAPAVRISVSDYRISAHDLPLPIILSAQKDNGPETAASKQATAQAALEQNNELLGITIETYLLSNKKDMLKNDHAMRHIRREASYGNMKWFRNKSDRPDEYDLQQTLKKPEVAPWSVPIDTFGPARNHTFMRRPAMPSPELPANPSILECVEAWHALLADGHASVAHATLILDVLVAATRPVRDLEVFTQIVQ